jgi:hypothetical protein
MALALLPASMVVEYFQNGSVLEAHRIGYGFDFPLPFSVYKSIDYIFIFSMPHD